MSCCSLIFTWGWRILVREMVFLVVLSELRLGIHRCRGLRGNRSVHSLLRTLSRIMSLDTTKAAPLHVNRVVVTEGWQMVESMTEQAGNVGIRCSAWVGLVGRYTI